MLPSVAADAFGGARGCLNHRHNTVSPLRRTEDLWILVVRAMRSPFFNCGVGGASSSVSFKKANHVFLKASHIFLKASHISITPTRMMTTIRLKCTFLPPIPEL